MKNRYAWMAAVGITLLLLGILLSVFEFAVLDRSFHVSLYERFGSAAAAGISEEEMENVSGAIVDYLTGKTDALEATAVIDGTKQAVFNEREIRHMEDVRRLFDAERKAKIALLAAGLIVFAFAANRIAQNRKRVLCYGVICASLGVVLLFLLFSLWVAADFTRAFTWFHQALFRNDLWLLNPETDRMIRMMPEAFFLTLAQRAAELMASATIMMFLGGVIGLVLPTLRKKKRAKKKGDANEVR